jgi:hypothetical protein
MSDRNIVRTQDRWRGLFGDLLPDYHPICPVLFSFVAVTEKLQNGAFSWSEREDLNLRPLVSQTSALTGLRHAPMLFP